MQNIKFFSFHFVDFRQENESESDLLKNDF